MNTTVRTLASLAVLAAFSIIAAGTADSSKDSGSSSGPSPAKPKTYEYVTESCSELSKRFGPQSKLSDLQKEEQWKAYKGKAFKWNLQVTEVSSDTFGGYSVQFKCANDSPSFIQDVQVKYEDEHKNVVMQMNKDEVYQVEGELKMSMTLLGMTADAIVR